jgi:hypothetical protein
VWGVLSSDRLLGKTKMEEDFYPSYKKELFSSSKEEGPVIISRAFSFCPA